jgi:hypothetical protein
MAQNSSAQTALPNSNALRLSDRQWLVVAVALLALVVSAPAIWRRIERFNPGPDYRIPYELSSDYWLYHRYSAWVSAREDKIAVIGDSVIWGHYVPPDGTLSHYLNAETYSDRFANLGLDGTHPAALQGLIAYYGESLARRAVLLQFNPLWLTSEKHDLQTTKEFHFNHPKLVPQFVPSIPCYRASLSARLWAVTERYVPFFSWTTHLKIAYFEGMDLPGWTLQHPYDNPLAAFAKSLPGSEMPDPRSEIRNPKPANVAWVMLDSSVQWRFFRHTVERLRARNCRVFVLVGPFNERTLNDQDAAAYGRIKRGIETWLQANDVPHFIAPPLPASFYADLSHPLPEGYAQLASQLVSNPAFRSAVITDH